MEKIEKPTISTVAKINNVEIVVISNGEKRVAVKPICEALGVDFSSQLQKLKEDPILSLTMGLSTTVGADGKDREMVTIPFEFVFGWLFRIDSRNVKESAKEAVLKYQVECYHALYLHFTGYASFVTSKEDAIKKQTAILKAKRRDFNLAKDELKTAEINLFSVVDLTFQQYLQMGSQLSLFETNEMEG